MDGMRENESIDGHTHDDDAHEGSLPVDDHSDSHAEDSTVHEQNLDLAAVRAKLREKSGKQYWRSLEELADDPHFEELLHREFPQVGRGIARVRGNFGLPPARRTHCSLR
jgi:hypothetical protein